MDDVTEIDLLQMIRLRKPNGSKDPMLQNARRVLRFAVNLHNSINEANPIIFPLNQNDNGGTVKPIFVPAKRELFRLGPPTFEGSSVDDIFDHMETHNIRVGICMIDNFSFVVVNNRNRFIIVEPSEKNVYTFVKGNALLAEVYKTFPSFQFQIANNIDFFDLNKTDLTFFSHFLEFENFATKLFTLLSNCSREIKHKFALANTKMNSREQSKLLFDLLCDQDFLGEIDTQIYFRNIAPRGFAWKLDDINELDLQPGQWLLIRNNDNFPQLIIATKDTVKSGKYFVGIGSYACVTSEAICDFHVLAAHDGVSLSDRLLTPFDQAAIPVGGKLYTMLNRLGL